MDRQIRGIYDNVWYIDTLHWYNSNMDQYMVLLPDVVDFIKLSDIDGVDMIMKD